MLPPEHIINQHLTEKSLPLIMGILNVTTDSFSDGNRYLNYEDAIKHAHQMISDRVDIIDVGGESTRPGSEPVSLKDELNRVIPVIKEIRRITDIPISVDTRKAEVAKQAIYSGANIVNDISALRYDKDMIHLLAANHQVVIILMHMQGEPSTMQVSPHYNDVIQEIKDFLLERVSYCTNYYINLNRIIIDPGIGFGKTTIHNLKILSDLRLLHSLGTPLVVGASRKRFINDISECEPYERIGGSLAATQACLEAGVEIIRVHDVKEHRQYIKVARAILEAG